MLKDHQVFRKYLVLLLIVAITTVAGTVLALDGAKDRRGLFWGMGFGGGGAVVVSGGDTGGEVNFDIQLGAGVSNNLTSDFDIDIYTIIFKGQRQVIINPGPEINYFFGDTGLFIRGAFGAAMNIINVGNDSDFLLGFDVGFGLGWEFFANTNLALGLAAEADYIVRQGEDLALFGFMFGLRYY